MTIKVTLLKDFPDCPKGTVGTLNEEGCVEFLSTEPIQLKEYLADSYLFTIPYCKSKPDWFKVEEIPDYLVQEGDFVICIGDNNRLNNLGLDSSGWVKGKVFKVKQIRAYKDTFIYWPVNGGDGVFAEHVRKATKEEVDEYECVMFGPYEAIVKGSHITFGCQHFSLQELILIRKLLDKEIEATITIKGKQVTYQIIEKLINKLTN